MFCPKCRTEYRDGFTRCNDCQVDLVKNLPAEETQESEDLVEVLATFNQADIAIIKSVLDNHKIEYYFFDEHMSIIRPAVLPARLMAKKSDIKRIVEIIKDLDLNYHAFSFDNNSSEKNIHKQKKKSHNNVDIEKEQNKIAFCLECKLPFSMKKRYEDTNLCEECFNKSIT